MRREHLSEKIIGCAFTVYNKMGYGFLEPVYERCLILELRKNELHVSSQLPIPVYYANEKVGDFIADLIINGTILVEQKSMYQLNRMHEAQVVNYLTATGIDIGLLINFGPEKVQIKRKVRIL